MRWIIGLDHQGHHEGAVAFARWISQRTPKSEFIGEHVIESVTTPLLIELEIERRQEAERKAQARLLAPLRELGIFSELGTAPATTADQGLIALAKNHDCDAIVMGRRKPVDYDRLIRLGRVTRRVLRHSSVPVVVVPPNMIIDEFGGPILFACDLSDSSIDAARFAARMGETTGVEVLATHVTGVPSDLRVLAPADAWDSYLGQAVVRGQAALDEWVAQHGPAGARTSVVHGDLDSNLLGEAKRAGASMIVVGSRGLSGFDRLFVSSIGSALASVSPIPVAVVPSR